jgi:hypothetical protein
MVRLWLCLFACGTDKAADSKPEPVDLGSDDTSATGSDDSATPDGDDTATGDTTDSDGDGYSVADGDCDDANPDIHPAAADDQCDGVDDNCDGVNDDEANDAQEPNDIVAHDLGDLSEVPETVLTGLLNTESDVDAFALEIEDLTGVWFSIEVSLSDVPADADYGLRLFKMTRVEGDPLGEIETADEYLHGLDEQIWYAGDWIGDDSGRYEVIVYSAGGFSCSQPYTLTIKTRQPPL